eukprot:TRINITY_DN3564_c0_g1_i14.p1 TRINITY_DN3564_c0_g1~~TRINITY_DN3564_c0_g1_i14.p1  ORF type:complete len:311 (-),score=70.46 TRINITY_DN3564_c0_g1_i14:592-1524(-)
MNVIICFLFFFFFQAEDGIRDAQESRGLGDVYKRQYQRRVRGLRHKEMSSSNEQAVEAIPPLLTSLHAKYVLHQKEMKDTFEYWVTEHLRLAGVYWGLCTMHLLREPDAMDPKEVSHYVLSCQHPDGGFGGNVNHDPHITYTLYAVQCLAMCDKLHLLDHDRVVQWVVSMQQPDGSFAGDKWGEIDTRSPLPSRDVRPISCRFSYCGLSCLRLLNQLEKANVPQAVAFVASCQNFDGGFGCIPGAETHAAQVFVCVGALAITVGWGRACQKVRACDSGVTTRRGRRASWLVVGREADTNRRPEWEAREAA